MNRLSELGRRLRMVFQREQFDRDLQDEMRLHLELRQKEFGDTAQAACELATEVGREACGSPP